ncbi:MAG: hypothetical protein KJ869_00395, partial [Candidatus Edwardsbacteria bacterium]|nr:hypothetical protein [Candidatus Edwardsbacteria bacterium]
FIKVMPAEIIIGLLILAIISVVFFSRKYINQKKLYNDLQKVNKNNSYQFVSRFGAFWKLFYDDNYIEDFPYCTCCEPKQVLSIVKWYPNEEYKCSKTGNIISLFDAFYISKTQALESLRWKYSKNKNNYAIGDMFLQEYNRLKELSPETQEKELLAAVFNNKPFERIPKKERETILKRFNGSQEIIRFLIKNQEKYIALINK